jgi:hypothetical protein
VSNAILDVSGFTLIQRSVGNEDRVTMFAVMEGLFGVGLLAGSLAAPALDALVGPRGALVVAGCVLPVCALLSRRTIVRAGGRGAAAEERLALLRRNAFLRPLTALDRLAEGMSPPFESVRSSCGRATGDDTS